MPELESFQKRQTAYKIKIQDIINSKYVKTEGLSPNYLEVNSQEISRINLIGVVVSKSELANYKSITLDDGSGKISARVFENNLLLDTVNVGDIVLLIGRPREFSSEKYMLIEIIKKIDPNWAKVRNLELVKDIQEEKTAQATKEDNKEEVIDLNPKNRITALIKNLDEGEGVAIERITSKDIENVDKLIDTLLKEGDIFEVKPGRLKVLE